MDDDEKGYGKPPKANRFQPGVSGNPKGRPKGAKGLKSEIKSVLGEFVDVQMNGRNRRVRKLRLIIMALAQKAAKGDVRAAEKILGLIVQMEGFEDPSNTQAKLTETEEMILAQFLGGVADEPSEGTEPSQSSHQSVGEGQGAADPPSSDKLGEANADGSAEEDGDPNAEREGDVE